MAELAAGAVSTLLGVIRNETLLLTGVAGDVQFIKEEMESMNSFLLHLARTSPPGGEHDEQVRTWMNQVRVLAHDCNNCIDMYLYRGNREVYRVTGGLRRYLWWFPWFVQKIIAQRRAAVQLRELKERARDVGERRLRYGVEVPAKKTAAGESSTPPDPGAVFAGREAPARDDHIEEDDNGGSQVAAATDHPSRRVLFQPPVLEDYLQRKLSNWIRDEVIENKKAAGSIPSIAIVVSDTETIEDAGAIARQALAVAATHFPRNVSWVVDMSAAADLYYPPLLPWELLCYILLEHAKSQPEQHTPYQAIDLYNEIQGKIIQMKFMDKIKRIEGMITGETKGDRLQHELEKQIDEGIEPLGVLLQVLQLLLTPPEHDQDQARKKGKNVLASYNIGETARKLQEFLQSHDEERTGNEAGTAKALPINLHPEQYVHILQDLFPTSKPLMLAKKNYRPVKQSPMATSTSNTLGEHQIKEITQSYTREIIHELLEDTLKKLARGDQPTQEKASDATEETKRKIQVLQWEIEDQLVFKGIMDKIDEQFRSHHDRTLIIIKDEKSYIREWNKIRNALSLSRCVAGVVIVTTAEKGAKQYCYPQGEPITYSLVGFYHNLVLELTDQQGNDDKDYTSQIFHDILDKCEPHEFCMKIFTHTLYANPRRSIEELQNLRTTLVRQKTLGSNAKKMFKFSYSNLAKEYKTCLLYLAIFPRGHTIRRSTLVARWVAEGLITKDDWHSSVQRAEQCFDALIDRWLVHPMDIGAAGTVKSCVVRDPVHELITYIAKKQHIMEARLSHHLARHFSIFNDLRLRGSDSILTFLRKLRGPSQYSRLKLLDLEGCHFSQDKHHYLRHICSKILLLKYLSLRGTDISHLPTAINNLHELEVLDIRETRVPESATKHILLLKLKRLLSGYNDLNSSGADTKISSSCRIPYKIEKMVNMEVLSNVKASRNGGELKDLGKLFQLRKLGVVIKDTDSQLSNLLRAISDLHECLQSLSITLPKPTGMGGSSNIELQKKISEPLKDKPKNLESLSINGTTQKVDILSLLATKDCDKLAKLTLSNASLSKDNLKVLSMLPRLRCVRLRHISYMDTSLTLKKDEFQMLKYFIIVASDMTDITFEKGAAPELEKIVLSATKINSLSGVEELPKLEEIDTSSNLLSLFNSANRIAKVTLRDDLLRKSDIQTLAKKRSIRCLVLLGKSCDETGITFNMDDFPNLNFLTVDCPAVTNISFSMGSTPKLQKIILSVTNMQSLSGVDNLQRLKEFEINTDLVPNEVEEAIKNHKNKPGFKHNKPANKVKQ